MIPRIPLSWIIALVLAVLLAVQTVRIEGFRLWPISHTGLKDQVSDLRGQLKAATSKRDEQARTTERTITETRVIYRDADKVAERIQKAPTAPECKTPPEIMGADL